MSHGTVAKQSTYPGFRPLKRIQTLVLNLLGILANRVEQFSSAGTIVPAGGKFTPDAVLTIAKTGKVALKMNTSFTTGAATVHAVASLSFNGGPFFAVYSWAPVTTGFGDLSLDVEFDTPVTPGQTVAARWTSSLGDTPAVLGNPALAATSAAVLRLEELP